MKVLKPGRKQRGWSIKATCTGSGNDGGGCGAELLVEQGDLFKTTSTDMKCETTTYVTFKCCECGVLTDLGQKAWPPQHVVDSLRVKNPAGIPEGHR